MRNIPAFSFFYPNQLAMKNSMRKKRQGRKPVKVYGGQHEKVIYEYSDGTRMARKGGQISWRNTNPGNIKVGNIAKENGSMGTNGPFAIFPDFETGRLAIFKLFRHDTYINLTLEQAITQYAPPKEGDNTEAFIIFIEKRTGYSRMDLIKNMSIWLLVAAIILKIGYWAYVGAEYLPILFKNYKWYTQLDKRVRPSHKKREGRIFSWDDPPKGGHPGEDYGCRCWA